MPYSEEELTVFRERLAECFASALRLVRPPVMEPEAVKDEEGGTDR
jgi:hypothetical protein